MEISFIKTSSFHDFAVHKLYLNNCFEAFALIPAVVVASINGSFEIKLFHDVPENDSYANHHEQRISRPHVGMLGFRAKAARAHLLCVFPGFDAIGNHHIYLADNIEIRERRDSFRYMVRNSSAAYARVYGKITQKLSSGNRVFIRYFNT